MPAVSEPPIMAYCVVPDHWHTGGRSILHTKMFAAMPDPAHAFRCTLVSAEAFSPDPANAGRWFCPAAVQLAMLGC